MPFKTKKELEAIGITISIVENNTVLIKQNKLTNQRIYTNKQLYKMGRELFPDKMIKPVVFHFNRNDVTLSWIITQMEHHKVIIKDLVRQLPISKEEINSILKEERPMTALEKGLLFYYFMCFEVE